MFQYIKRLKANQKVLLIHSLMFLLVSILLSFLIEYGDYWKTLLGEPNALVFDPGGWYIPSGAYFFRARTPFFWGHPGLILQMIVGVVVEVTYFLFSFWRDVPYPTFFLKNYPQFTTAIAIIISLFHLPIFYILYKFSRAFFKDRLYPTIAVIAFSTTITTLTYINVVSPDVICTFLILISSYTLIKAFNQDVNGKRFIGYVVLSSIAITSAIFSKTVYGAPAYVATFTFLVFFKPAIFSEDPALRKNILKIFIPVSLISALAWSTKMDYLYFFDYWFGIADDHSLTIMQQIKILLSGGAINTNAVVICEWLYILLMALGIKNILSDQDLRQKPETMLLFLILAFTLPMSIIKGRAVHYKYVPFSIGAIPFSYQLKVIFDKYFAKRKWTRSRKMLIVMFSVLVIHSVSLYTASSHQVEKVKNSIQLSRPLNSALRDIDYDEKIAVNEDLAVVRKYYMIVTKDSPQPIQEAFSRFFIYAKSIDDIPADSGVKFFVDIIGTPTSAKQLY